MTRVSTIWAWGIASGVTGTAALIFAAHPATSHMQDLPFMYILTTTCVSWFYTSYRFIMS